MPSAAHKSRHIRKPSLYIECRHCHRPIGALGMGNHMKSRHQRTWDLKEVKLHGYTRDPAGHLSKLGTPVTSPAPIPELDSMPVPTPMPVPTGLRISEEAMRIAISGLEKIQAEISGHIADCRATLEPPVRRGRGPGRPKNISSSPPPDGQPLPTSKWKLINGVAKKVWSNDPGAEYQHYSDGRFRLLNGQPMLKQPVSQAKLDSIAVARAAKAEQRKTIATPAVVKSAPIKVNGRGQEITQ